MRKRELSRESGDLRVETSGNVFLHGLQALCKGCRPHLHHLQAICKDPGSTTREKDRLLEPVLRSFSFS